MFIIQMTGLSGAGKSTLAAALKTALEEKDIAVEVIDGDEYRKTICSDLGFSEVDRRENIRRLAAVANGFCKKGSLAIIAAINPFEDIRRELREKYNAKTVWIKCDLALLMQRDPKGLYKKALLPDEDPQKIRNLSGINDPYEIPLNVDLVLDTGKVEIETSKAQLLQFALMQRDVVWRDRTPSAGTRQTLASNNPAL